MTNVFPGVTVGVANEHRTIHERYAIYFFEDGVTHEVGERDSAGKAVIFAEELLTKLINAGAKIQSNSLWVQMLSKVNHYKDGMYVGSNEYDKIIWVAVE